MGLPPSPLLDAPSVSVSPDSLVKYSPCWVFHQTLSSGGQVCAPGLSVHSRQAQRLTKRTFRINRDSLATCLHPLPLAPCSSKDGLVGSNWPRQVCQSPEAVHGKARGTQVAVTSPSHNHLEIWHPQKSDDKLFLCPELDNKQSYNPKPSKKPYVQPISQAKSQCPHM